MIMRVADSGPGIAPENFDKLFTLFFTTKSSGMGVGLALTRRAIEHFGGSIRAERGRERGQHRREHGLADAEQAVAGDDERGARTDVQQRGGEHEQTTTRHPITLGLGRRLSRRPARTTRSGGSGGSGSGRRGGQPVVGRWANRSAAGPSPARASAARITAAAV